MTCPYLPSSTSGSVPSIDKFTFYDFFLTLSGNLSIPFISEDGNTSFTIDFFTYANPYSLLVSMDGSNLIVELSEGDADGISAQITKSSEESMCQVWTVEVYSIDSASVKAKVNATEKRCIIDTSGWQSGTYVVMATIVGKTVSKKINIM